MPSFSPHFYTSYPWAHRLSVHLLSYRHGRNDIWPGCKIAMIPASPAHQLCTRYKTGPLEFSKKFFTSEHNLVRWSQCSSFSSCFLFLFLHLTSSLLVPASLPECELLCYFTHACTFQQWGVSQSVSKGPFLLSGQKWQAQLIFFLIQ